MNDSKTTKTVFRFRYWDHDRTYTSSVEAEDTQEAITLIQAFLEEIDGIGENDWEFE